jgi:hypothetical protein
MSYELIGCRGSAADGRRYKRYDAVSLQYIGKPWPYRDEKPIVLVIEVNKAHYSTQPFEHRPRRAA